jgi:hypothetical protein
MIGPRLALKAKQATMLAYLTTDAKVPRALLASVLADASDESFNAVTVDDHASTNDTAAIIASGASGVTVTGRDARKFADALKEVCRSLAYQIAADGEGATEGGGYPRPGGVERRGREGDGACGRQFAAGEVRDALATTPTGAGSCPPRDSAARSSTPANAR